MCLDFLVCAFVSLGVSNSVASGVGSGVTSGIKTLSEKKNYFYNYEKYFFCIKKKFCVFQKIFVLDSF